MAIGLATAGLIGAGVSAASTIGTNAGNIFANKAEAQRQRDFNALEAEKNRDFQKEMRDTALISSVEQAKKLGISPSLVLGQGSSSLGGSQASASQTHHSSSGVSNAVTGVLSMLEKEEQLKAMQEINEDRLLAQKEMNQNRLLAEKEMNEDRLQAQKEMNDKRLDYLKSKNQNPKSANKRQYSKAELDSMFDDIDSVII